MRLKDGTRASSAKLKDIDFSPDEEEYKKALRFWDIFVEHKPLEPNDEKPFSFYGEEYYLERYGNRETYAKSCATFYTYAVVPLMAYGMNRAVWDGLEFLTQSRRRKRYGKKNSLKTFSKTKILK